MSFRKSRVVAVAFLATLPLFAQEPSAFGAPVQEQEMRFDSAPSFSSQPLSSPSTSVSAPRPSAPKNTAEEIADIKEKLFNINSSLKTLQESQEGLKSVFEGQTKRMQSLSSTGASANFATKDDLNSSLGEITKTLNANFSVYDENFKTIKESIKALGELIDKLNKSTKADIDSLRTEMDEVRKAAGLKPKPRDKEVTAAPTASATAALDANKKTPSSATAPQSAQSAPVASNFSKQDNFTVYKEATEFLEQGKLPDAKARLEWTAKNQYKPASSNYLLGEIAFREKRYKDAIYYYKESATMYDKADYMPRLLLNSAKSFTQTGDKENSKRFLESIVSLYPDSSEAKEAKKLLGK